LIPSFVAQVEKEQSVLTIGAASIALTSGTASKAALVLETPAEQLLSACLTPELPVQVEEEECTMEKSFSATVQPPSLKKVDPDMERSQTASPLTPRNAEVCMQSSQHLN